MFGSGLSRAQKLEVKLMVVGFTRREAHCLAQASFLAPEDRDSDVPKQLFSTTSPQQLRGVTVGIFNDLMRWRYKFGEESMLEDPIAQDIRDGLIRIVFGKIPNSRR